MQRLAAQMGIRKPIHLLSSTLARTPSMVGHFRPAIILPIAIINQLDTKDVEAILAHELAHIWRHDFVVNLLQSIVDLLYYYHPAIYYISEQARIEREHCCDDMAIQHTGHATDYAKTLVKLQEIKHHTYTPSLAMHMQRSKNAFMNRIFRILSQPINTPRPSSKLAVLALLFALTIGLHEHAISSSNTHVENIASLDPQQLTSPNFSPVSLPMDVDTTPVEKTIIKKKVISIVNGDTIVTETITENDGADRQIIVNGNVFPFADSDIQMFRLDSLGNTMKMITKDVNINVMMDSLNSGMAKIKMFLNNDGKTMNWDSLIPLGEKARSYSGIQKTVS